MIAVARHTARPAWIVPTLAMVAGFFGVSHAVVRADWRPSWPADCGKPGAWNLQAILRWRDGRRCNPGGAGPDHALLARRQLAEAQTAEERARRLKLANDEREGRTANVEDIRLELREVLLRLKDRIEELPEEVAMEIPPEHRLPVVENIGYRITLALSQIASWASAKGASLDQQPATAATAESVSPTSNGERQP